MNDYNESQTRTFKTFLVFTMSCLSILLILMTVTSQTYRISEIAYNFSEDFELISLEQLYGKSIWMVDENSFEGVYTDNPDIKKLSITKDLPSRLLITVEVYEKMAYLYDQRSSITKIKLLHENNHSISVKEVKFPISIVQILNGPVGEGFNGEIISLFKTLEKYEYSKKDLTLEYDGKGLVAFYNKGTYELGDAIDLGKKGSVLGAYLKRDFCNGTVRFISSDSTVENCT